MNTKKLRQIVLDLSIPGLIIVFIGSVMLWFPTWQEDIMWVPKMWGNAHDNAIWFQHIFDQGYASWSKIPFTINYELFPNMVAGEAYDLLMIVNILSWLPLVIGGYLLGKKTLTIGKSYMKYKLYKIRKEGKYIGS